MNKASILVLSAMALFGIAFPVSVAIANRPQHVEIVREPAPAHSTVLPEVTVTPEQTPQVIQLEEVVVKPTSRHVAAPKAEATKTCRSIDLEQQGRPGSRSVLMCG